MLTESEQALKPAIILDTNVLISGLLFPRDATRQTIIAAFADYRVVFSEETWDELSAVIQRSEFEKRLPLHERLQALEAIAVRSEVYAVTAQATDCRDAKDNKFLDLARETQAQYIVTGDQDLLVLHPWYGVNVIAPTAFLAMIRVDGA